MSYLNSVTLVGFVGADPEQRQARSNGAKSPFFPSLPSAPGKRAGRVELKNRVAPHLHLPSATGRTRRYGDQEGRARPRRRRARQQHLRAPERQEQEVRDDQDHVVVDSRRRRAQPRRGEPEPETAPAGTARWRRPTALHSEAVFFKAPRLGRGASFCGWCRASVNRPEGGVSGRDGCCPAQPCRAQIKTRNMTAADNGRRWHSLLDAPYVPLQGTPITCSMTVLCEAKRPRSRKPGTQHRVRFSRRWGVRPARLLAALHARPNHFASPTSPGNHRARPPPRHGVSSAKAAESRGSSPA